MITLYFYRKYLDREAREALEAIRYFRAAGDLLNTEAWACWYNNVNVERRMVHAMTPAQFRAYWSAWLASQVAAPQQLTFAL